MGHRQADGSEDPLAAALAAASRILPDQGPLGVFIHHNTLHAFQHLPFHAAVQRGAELLGARPYLELDAYRAAYAVGRIEAVDVAHALSQLPDDDTATPVALGLSLRAFRELLMLHDPVAVDAAGLAFNRRRGPPDARDDARHRACRDAVARCPSPSDGRPRVLPRHRDVLLALGGGDTDLSVMRELVRLAAAFLDQGQMLAPMPGRDGGFLAAVAALYADGTSAPRGAPGVDRDFTRVHTQRQDARAVIAERLALLGVAQAEHEAYLVASAVALAGWAGMFARLEAHPEESHGVPVSLADYMAVRLILEHRAIAHEAAVLEVPLELPALRAAAPVVNAHAVDDDAERLTALARAAGLDAAAVDALDTAAISAVWQQCAAFPALARRAVWLEAYEGWYRRQILDAMVARRAAGLIEPPDRPAAQFLFCIDEREESMRRAIEEQGLQFETLGGAGFFGVAIDYQGLYDTAPSAHCPVVVTPEHEIYEAPLPTEHARDRLRRRLRDGWNSVHRGAHCGSRTLAGGAGLSLLLGPLAAIAAIVRVVMPRASLSLHARLRDVLFPRPRTRLSALRTATADTRTERGKLPGFSLDEAADRVAAVLRSTGLAGHLAPIVILLGHGSTSLNNPHESAHDCGACGGRRGGANARLFADIANRPDVREAVRARGVEIPADTWFIGGLHDTADDGVHYYDLEALPTTLYGAFEVADQVLQTARQLSAQERCRRFHHAALGLSPASALRHVEARAAHFGQPRPEYGHCTNAIAVVGRRQLTRGLHLDRRPFLISYDPSLDPDGGIIERVLAAVGPVGAGINLEYYFSAVDNERYGCGTKLPHNVTGLIGIMNGHLSDLRTGLPLQMVELHEPMRLLLIVEATPARLLEVAGRQAEVRELVVNEWVQLVSVDPASGAMQVFERGRFVPYVPGRSFFPRVAYSQAWHGTSREHLTPALIEAPVDMPPSAVRAARAAHG